MQRKMTFMDTHGNFTSEEEYFNYCKQVRNISTCVVDTLPNRFKRFNARILGKIKESEQTEVFYCILKQRKVAK